jgi:hypothetical protein
MLKGKQKKIDANKDGKISGDDFKILQSKKGMKAGGVLSDKEFKSIQKMNSKPEMKSNGVLSEKELKFIQNMNAKPEKKSKGGSIFSRQNYKRTGKI